MINRVPDQLTGIELGRSAALNAVLAAVKPVSAMNDIYAKLNLANGFPSANYASQLSPMLSQRDALAGVIASSAVSDVIARSGVGVHSAFVAAQAAQIVTAQDSIARLLATTSTSASMANLLDTVSRYGQVQTHLGASQPKRGQTPRANWKLRGRSPKVSARQEAHLAELHATGTKTPAGLAHLFGIGRSTVYRAIARTAEANRSPAADPVG